MAETAMISLSSFGPGRVFQYFFWLGSNMVRDGIEIGCELAQKSKIFSAAGELHLYICLFPPRVFSVYSAGLGGMWREPVETWGGSPHPRFPHGPNQ
jgi:hypothetical protein